jgi:8-oxo-dGTP diphosphatase
MNKPILTAAYAIIEKDGKILKIRRSPGDSNAGMWEIPGGGVDPKELPIKAITREVREETGLIIYPTSLVGVKHFETKEKYQIQLIFKTKLIGSSKVKLSHEHDNFRWEEV